MHLSRLAWAALLLAAGCTTPAPGQRGPGAVGALRLTSVDAMPNVDSWCPPELAAALRSFLRRAHAFRAQRESGDLMPASEVDNWRELLTQIDGYLARLEAGALSYREGTLRQALEGQLEQDIRTYGELPADLVEGLLARMDRLSLPGARARRPGSRALPVTATFIWPVEPVEVTSTFGWRVDPLTGGHEQHQGLDLAARPGQPVKAAGDGVVVRAQFGSGHGNYVEMDHGGGVMTRYSHLSSLLVSPGDSMKKGDVLGLAGSTGRATGAHLHFELWRGGEAVDPLGELGPPTHIGPVADR